MEVGRGWRRMGEYLNLCAMTFSKAFEEGGRISCFFLLLLIMY